MSRTQTMVQLTDELVALLDNEAARAGLSRSALIRQILADHLRDEVEADVTRRIVAGYRRIPPATPDEWGDSDGLLDRTAADTLRRLDAEERASGLPPW